jgi:hypothetical protein
MQLMRFAALLLAVLPVLFAQPDRSSTPACHGSDQERRTGLDFFSRLADSEEGPLESVR